MLFPERLDQELHLQKLTQTKFAQLIGVTQQAVSRWVNGVNQPDIDQLILCSNCLNVSVDYLIGLSDIRNIQKNPAPAAPDPEPSTDMPKDIAELKRLITSIVNQALASSQQSTGAQSGPADPPARRAVER